MVPVTNFGSTRHAFPINTISAAATSKYFRKLFWFLAACRNVERANVYYADLKMSL